MNQDDADHKAMIDARWGYAHNRLRDGSGRCDPTCILCENERLKEECRRYRAALEQIDQMGDLTDTPFHKAGGTQKIFRITEKALKEQP